MPRLSNEKINEIRQSVDIVDVIGNYLPLERRGRNYLARCPFHNDDHPSMSVSPEKQIYRCFVCSHGGNVFTFLQDYLKISFMEAVKMVAQMGNVDLGDFTFYEEKPHVNQELEPYYLMHEEANRIYKHYLTTKLALEANSYLSQRHLSKDIIDYFNFNSKKKPKQIDLFIEFSDDENLIVNYLKTNGKQHIDKMSFDLNLKSYELMPTLLDLELKQIISTLPGKFYDLL